MPIYEYECPSCGRVFEEWVKSSDAHKEEPCPECGTLSPRVMSRTSFVLKGDGWYVSDYGYRKGITEDGGPAPHIPAKSTPTSPAKQGEKGLVAKNDTSGQKSDAAAKKAPKKEKDKAAPKPAAD